MGPENTQSQKKIWFIIGGVVVTLAIITGVVIAVIMNQPKADGSTPSVRDNNPSSSVDSLQASQRDTMRKNEVGQVLAAINQYRANNRGRVPTSDMLQGTAFTKGSYLASSDVTREIVVDSPSDTTDKMNVHLQKTCDGADTRGVSISIGLETSSVRYCAGD